MSSRLEFVLLAQQPGANVAALCRSFEVSRKTAYKWLERYRIGGHDGLADQSRKPISSPMTSSGELELQVLALHLEYPCWGARKLRALLPKKFSETHHNTIDSILRRHGCRILGASYREPDEAPNRFEHEAPNALWQMDFKGHFALTDKAQGRCHPLTILDDHSRFSVCLTACGDERYPTVRAALQATFEMYGLPERMTADNGPPWGSGSEGLTRLEAWIIRVGVDIGHSRKYHPQTQGKDERFHRTLKLELLSRKGFGTLAQCQKSFDSWRDQYNTIRPHQALNQQPPISRYRQSARTYPHVLAPIEYLPGDTVRKVGHKGEISYAGHHHFVGQGLRGEHVAVRPSGADGVLDVYYCRHFIRQIELKTLP